MKKSLKISFIAASVTLLQACTEESTRCGVSSPAPPSFVLDTSPDITGITPVSAKVARFDWVSSLSPLSRNASAEYTVCEHDETKEDSCYPLGTAVDKTSLEVTLPLHKSITDQYFILAESGAEKLVSATKEGISKENVDLMIGEFRSSEATGYEVVAIARNGKTFLVSYPNADPLPFLDIYTLRDTKWEKTASIVSNAEQSNEDPAPKSSNEDTSRKGDSGSEAGFGRAIAINDSGSRIAIFSSGYGIVDEELPPGDGSARTLNRGSVLIYDIQPDGSWAKTSRINSPRYQPRFGQSIAFDGTGQKIAISAIDYTPGPFLDEVGAIFVFQENIEGQWENESLITSSTFTSDDGFARRIDMSKDGNNIASSSHGYGRNGALAYFHRNGDAWDESHLMSPIISDYPIKFGRNFSLSGNATTLAVAAPFYDDQHSKEGKVFIYRRASASEEWQLEQSLSPESPSGRHKFGMQVELDDAGNTLAISWRSYGNDKGVNTSESLQVPNSSTEGAISTYKYSDGTWSLQSYLKPLTSSSNFGDSLSISGDGRTVLTMNEDGTYLY